MATFFSNGKLLLTGEYVVLDGALALAVPTRFGQSLTVETSNQSKLIWKSLDMEGKIWFEDEFTLEQITSGIKTPGNAVSDRIFQILTSAKQLNTNFLNAATGFEVTTMLDFPQNWGLGSSSTLINNIAQWANTDAYKLLELTFGGSGYDIACAQNNSAITYQLTGKDRHINTVDFNPEFRDHLFFVYLNKKQDSRAGIVQYREKASHPDAVISEINRISSEIIDCNSLDEFESLITTHEEIIGEITMQLPVKKDLFPDYDGAIKSLGAWGGDFLLVSASSKTEKYFRNKGYNIIIPYNDMVLKI